MKNQKTRFRAIIVAFGCFVLLSAAQAVVPPPDGGYPGRNTAEGQKALFNLTTGTDNTALGYSSLQALTTGNLNTGVGAWTLALNSADNNTACGAAALLFNGTGIDNTAIGTGALLFNTIGEGNTATGAFALYSNTEGQFNTANGEFTLYFNSTGDRNSAIGDSALYNNTTGSSNTAVGNPALLSNTTGNGNTAIGALALRSNIHGGGNTATGFNALFSNISGDENTANGHEALFNNTTGIVNTALGWKAGINVTTADDVICIGAAVFGENVSHSCYIGNIWQQPGGSQAVYVNSEGKLGAQVSSRRFKDEIKPMDQVSEAIYGLKPVSFRYKPEVEPSRPSGFGLIAEEVEKANSDLVARDKDGNAFSVRYDQVNAMLLNEFLKEHRKNEAQEATIAQQQKQIEALTAGLQKVSAQLEASKPAPRIVLNDE